MNRLILLLSLTLLSCSVNPCWTPHYNWGFNYEVTPTQSTPQGIQIDTTGQDLDPRIFEMIDTMTEEVLTCLEKNFSNGSLVKIKIAGFCKKDVFIPIVNKVCLVVKIPDDWHQSLMDPKQQVLANEASCEGCDVSKGCDPTKPCYWRAGLQDGHIVITTPNLYLYKDPLIKYITGCDSVWNVPELAECASPGRDPDWLKH